MKKTASVLLLFVLLTGALGFTVYGQDESKQPAAPKNSPGIEITRLVLATGVDNREPVGVANVFPASTSKVICFLDAKNIAAKTEVVFVWILNGKEILKTNLTLKAGPKWRTRAVKNLHGQKGDWKVEIRDAEGQRLKDVSFKVE